MTIADALQNYVPKFLENRLADVNQLKTAIAEADFEKIARLGHILKGVCRPFGFIEMETLGRKLEEASMQKNPEFCMQLATELNSLINQAQTQNH